MGRLTIQEIAKVLVTKNGLEQSEANRFATELFAIIQERLEKNDQVKVKGLGTWKVITVDARESVSVRTGGRVMIEEHSKITFTPDATMKELVNKPFSQFETVVLNDNVEFDDMKELPDDTDFEDTKEDMTEVELVQPEKDEQEPVVQQEEPVILQERHVIEEERHVIEEPMVEVEEPIVPPTAAPLIEVPEESVEDESEEVSEEVPEEVTKEVSKKVSEEISKEVPEEVTKEVSKKVSEKVSEEISKEVPEEEQVPIAFEDEDEEEKPNNSFKWAWIVLGAICLVIASAAGGYYYGNRQAKLVTLTDTVVVRDTIYVPEGQESTIAEVEDNSTKEVAPKEETPKVAEVKQEKPVAETLKVEKPKAEPAPEVDKYAAKDERVRLGAYRIVGLDHEVKVLQGQTFYSICRAHLGPDMECYIEVYNDLPRNPQIKAGQVIKIPKLQLKKRKKQ